MVRGVHSYHTLGQHLQKLLSFVKVFVVLVLVLPCRIGTVLVPEMLNTSSVKLLGACTCSLCNADICSVQPVST